MRKILTYGTFDLLHHGHIRLLERSRALGDHLTVAVSTDQFNLGKGKMCTYTYEERVHILEAIRYVDKVIPEKSWEQKVDDVKNNNIDIFLIGDDWEDEFDFLKEYCQVLYLPRTPDISTTKVKSMLAGNEK